MPIKFYMTPGSCSTGIHILLEHLELPFEVHIVNLSAGQHREPAYLAVNPNGTIPALVLNDGRVLTDFQSIAFWLAAAHPRAGLLPEDPVAAAKVIELMGYCVGTVHGLGYTRVFTTDAYLPEGLADEARAHWAQAVQARGREIVGQALQIIAADLPETGLAFGSGLTLADAALFYVEFWADKTGLPLPPRCAAHYQAMRARPVVQRVLAEEGYR